MWPPRAAPQEGSRRWMRLSLAWIEPCLSASDGATTTLSAANHVLAGIKLGTAGQVYRTNNSIFFIHCLALLRRKFATRLHGNRAHTAVVARMLACLHLLACTCSIVAATEACQCSQDSASRITCLLHMHMVTCKAAATLWPCVVQLCAHAQYTVPQTAHLQDLPTQTSCACA